MKRLVFGGLFALLAACGGTNVTKPKALDPDLMVRIRDQFDTTTAVGRTHWHIYLLLSSVESPSQAGIAPVGNISLANARSGINTLKCVRVASDSIGNRLMSLIAVGDTTNDGALTPDSTAQNIALAWQAGSRTLPAGYKALFIAPVDAWDSQQFANGHGLVASDPIRWGWDWTDGGATTFYEMDIADVSGCGAF